jgi:hypothetical protein
MKSLKLVLVVLVTGVFAAACDSGGGDSASANDLLEMTVNGAAWKADQPTAHRVSAGGYTTHRIFGSNIPIGGAEAEPETVTIKFSGQLSKGDYTIGDGHLDYITYVNPNYTDTPAYATSGTCTVTKVNDSEISGTFEFEAELSTVPVRPITVVNGRFNVQYSYVLGGS